MIAIPNMGMPRTCYECDSDLASSIGCEEWWVFEEGKEKRSPDCPLIEIDDEIWEALKPKVETMSLAERGWITDDSNT